MCKPLTILKVFFQKVPDGINKDIINSKGVYNDSIYKTIYNRLIAIRSLLLDSSDKNLVRNETKKLLGLGLGSTPESDDILMGFLFAFSNMNPKVDLEYLSKIPFEKFTTMISSRLLRSIIKGNYPAELINLCSYLKQNRIAKESKFEFEIRKVARIGSSTGLNFLRGVLFELEEGMKISNKRI